MSSRKNNPIRTSRITLGTTSEPPRTCRAGFFKCAVGGVSRAAEGYETPQTSVFWYVFGLDDGTGVGGDTRPEVGALLGDGTGDGGTLHLALGVDYHTAEKLKKCRLVVRQGIEGTHRLTRCLRSTRRHRPFSSRAFAA